MEKIYLHQLFQEISARLICPQCKKKISAQSLKIKESHKNICVFEAHCNHCDNVVNISAVVEAQLSKEGNKMNASSRISQNNSPISLEEIQDLKKILYRPSHSFSSLFRPQPPYNNPSI